MKNRRLDRIADGLSPSESKEDLFHHADGTRKLPPEVLYKMQALYDKLEPHRIDLVWWGERVDNESILREVLDFYAWVDIHYPTEEYEFTWFEGGKRWCYPYRYQSHILEALALHTKQWNESTEEERQSIVEWCRQMELKHQYDFMPAFKTTPEQYDRLTELIEEWDGTKRTLPDILEKAGIEPDEIRFGGRQGSTAE